LEENSMSAEDTLNEKSKRRRGLRRKAEVEPVDSVEEVDDESDDEDDDSSERGLTVKKGRVTPGRRTQELAETQSEGNFITRTVGGIGEYFEGVRSEIQKVAWPTREDVRRLAGIVLVTMIVSSLVLGTISIIYNEIFVLGISTPAIFVVIFVVVIAAFGYYLRQSNRRTGSY
jgi:preprotein translocase SecE subunit